MKAREYINWFENALTICVFGILTIFPAIEIFTRILGRPGVPASPILVQHMTLWIGFIGAVLATRQNKLLSLTKGRLTLTFPYIFLENYLFDLYSKKFYSNILKKINLTFQLSYLVQIKKFCTLKFYQLYK